MMRGEFAELIAGRNAGRERFAGSPQPGVCVVTGHLFKPIIDRCLPVLVHLLLHIGDDHCLLIGWAVKAMLKPLDGPGAMSSKTVDVFAVAAAFVRRRGKPFAFDRQ